MSELVFLAHIPLLQIDSEKIPCADGYLWQMPFETYNGLSLGAFSDHQQKYEETAPVFYCKHVDLDLPMLTAGGAERHGAIEMKMRSDNWDMLDQFGLGFVANFHTFFVDIAWSALSLAAPAATFPSPKLSATFVHSPGDAAFDLGDSRSDTIRVQGDADQEFLFLPEAAGPPLSMVQIERASSLFDKIEELRKSPELSAALDSLQATSAPSLSPDEQLTLSVIALESLLLPDVHSGLSKTFSGRLANLLASNRRHHRELKEIASQLYHSRSASLHGQQPRSQTDRDQVAEQAQAQQLLAAAISALAKEVASDKSVESITSQLDKPQEMFDNLNDELPRPDPPGLRRPNRLGQSTPNIAATFSPTASMGAPEGTVISWSPLAGLVTDDSVRLAEDMGPLLMPLSGTEIQSLEEKDIARDFIRQLLAPDQPPDTPIASVLTSIVETEESFSAVERIAPQLLRERDLGVIALRLAGHSQFHDPELLGAYIYHGNMRHRWPTALRQTLLRSATVDSEQFIGQKQTAPDCRLLYEYDSTARHFETETIFKLFRRGFDQRFLPPKARAGLLLAAFEAIFGRRPRKSDPVQQEDMVVEVVGTGAAETKWFVDAGRDFRNAVAHGDWDPDDEAALEPLTHLTNILRTAIPLLLRAWLDCDDRPNHRPGRVFINAVRSRIQTNR